MHQQLQVLQILHRNVHAVVNCLWLDLLLDHPVSIHFEKKHKWHTIIQSLGYLLNT